MERSASLTDLVRNAAAIAREISTEGTVYRITCGGRGAMILVDEEYFDGWMAAIEEMQRPDWREVLAETKRDVAAGRDRTLDSIVKEKGLEGSVHASDRKPARRASRIRHKKSR
jgi:PHD/YefM family antitoxin component YafN of YafNO toxin-antitoxin module